MSGKSSQRKGRAAELELANILKDCGLPVKAGDPANHGKCADLIGLPHFHVAIKRTERLDLWGALAQSERDSKKFRDGAPTVIFRRNRSPWFICLQLSDWLKLYKAAFFN